LKKRILILSLAIILGASLSLVGCGSSTPAPAAEPATPAAPAVAAMPASASGVEWTQDYISQVEPMMFRDTFLEILGQVDEPIPYYYTEAVKLSGHSCAAITGAWTITKKAMEALYGDETPVRGQIKITMPGPADQYFIGVFGEVFTYLTGAAPESGFPGSDFGPTYNRRNLLVYPEDVTKLPFAALEYVFERTDTGRKVGVVYNMTMVVPVSTPEIAALYPGLVAGTLTAEENATFVTWWNDRAINTLVNEDQEGFLRVRVIEEGN